MFQHSPETAFACDILPQAARVCMQLQAQYAGKARSKSDRSPVTAADLAAQAVICRGLAQAFPDDPVVAEEDSWSLVADEAGFAEPVVSAVANLYPEAELESVRRWIDRGRGQAGDRFWTVDPIDGTAGFVRGDQWVVALALVEGGRVTVGALAAPRLSPRLEVAPAARGSLLIAAEGEGAWLTELGSDEWRRLRVSDRADPRRARILASVESRHTNPERLQQLSRKLGTEVPLIRLDSQAKFALVAGGEAEMIFRLLSPERPNYREKIWDQAAGSLIVGEAGGQVTDLLGEPLDFSRGERLQANTGVLVSNGLLHQTALAALSELEAT